MAETRMRKGSSPTKSSDDNRIVPEEKIKTRSVFKDPISCCLLVLIVVVVIFGASFQQESTSSKTANLRKQGPVERTECTVYVAPSSLKGHPGFGIYTTRDINKNEKIIPEPDALSIPIEVEQVLQDDAHAQWTRVWDNYWYGHGVPEHVSYEGGMDILDFQLGLGCLPNHHCLLASLRDHFPEPAYDDSLLNRFKDPGAGAISYSTGRAFSVTRPVYAGEEMFLYYGWCEHGNRENPDWAESVTMTADYEKAADLVWDTIQGGVYSGGILTYAPDGTLALPAGYDPLVKQLLPQTRTDLDQVKADVKQREDLAEYLARKFGMNERTPEWVKENGMCLENLTPKPSTLHQAGRGAFAKFPIKKGEMVVPVPMLQIMDKALLSFLDEDGQHRGYQLLLNYCFNHPQSKLLLCPYTNAALINHCSVRKKQCGPDGPNAEYRWAEGWDPVSDDWRNKSLQDIGKERGRGLSFEIIALRDIEPGEEVFMDYGEEWEEAWEEHLKKWKPPPPPEAAWTSVKKANEGGPILESLVSGDLRKTTEDPYLFTGCQYWVSDERDFGQRYTGQNAWEQLDDQTILDRYADDGSRYGMRIKKVGYERHRENSYWPCTILKAEKTSRRSSDTYIVRIHSHPWQDTDLPWIKNKLPRILINYPREAIRYFVRPFKSDQRLPGVFRQPIGIRDDIFPNEWKNAA